MKLKLGFVSGILMVQTLPANALDALKQCDSDIYPPSSPHDRAVHYLLLAVRLNAHFPPSEGP